MRLLDQVLHGTFWWFAAAALRMQSHGQNTQPQLLQLNEIGHDGPLRVLSLPVFMAYVYLLRSSWAVGYGRTFGTHRPWSRSSLMLGQNKACESSSVACCKTPCNASICQSGCQGVDFADGSGDGVQAGH